MMNNPLSVDEIRALHQMEADKISDSIKSGNIDGLRVSKGFFAKGFSDLGQDERRAKAKARLKALNKAQPTQSMEP